MRRCTALRVNSDRGNASEALVVILLHRDVGRFQKQPGQCAHDRIPFLSVQAMQRRCVQRHAELSGLARRPRWYRQRLHRAPPRQRFRHRRSFVEKILTDEKLVKCRKANHGCTRRTDLHADA